MRVTSDLAQLAQLDALVVPGVGAFSACMAQLADVGGVDFVRDWVAQQRPLLGICVGFQVLFEAGAEHGIETPGIGIFPGEVAALPARRLPHMGWNTVAVDSSSQLFNEVSDERFYFVHSYGVLQGPPDAATSYSEHDGARFVAAIESGSVSATQFHPEKSGAAGARLLGNWLRTC